MKRHEIEAQEVAVNFQCFAHDFTRTIATCERLHEKIDRDVTRKLGKALET